MQWMKIKPDLHHRSFEGGDVVAVSASEMRAFDDKFTSANVDATEAAARLAQENAVRLRDITPTGKGGRIVKDDVRAVLDGNA